MEVISLNANDPVLVLERDLELTLQNRKIISVENCDQETILIEAGRPLFALIEPRHYDTQARLPFLTA